MHLAGITKSFGANRAVDDVSLTLSDGEIVGLVGENGAGKTTLMRIAAGELTADAGRVDGEAELVHQHFMLVGDFTIAENLALSAGRLLSVADAEAIVRDAGIVLGDVRRRVAELSVGEKAKLELIKAIAKRPRVLILDEPTSVLTPHEAEELFRVMRRLAAGGTAVVFISHKLPEVLAVAQRVVVMRRGKIVAEARSAETDAQRLATAMVGTVAQTAPMNRRPAESDRYVLSLPMGESHSSHPSYLSHPSHRSPAATHLNVAAHEIVAIVGVAGNGQSELAARIRDLTDATRTAHIPEDRTRDGIVAEMSIAENLALTAKRWHPRAAQRHAEAMIGLFTIRARDASQRVGDLSGGNQQKVVLARELSRQPELIVAAEPTRGLDIEAARFVHERLRAAANDGAAILLITSDLDEAFTLADGIHVIYRGRLSARMTTAEASTRVANLMAGVA
ncbi:MAG TPA: ATP-binding cassette domain-containing protein [Thermoanaerobaculia bacterium]